MKLDKKILVLCFTYILLLLFFIIILTLPLRVIYIIKDVDVNLYLPLLDTPYFLLEAKNIPYMISRGSLPFIVGMILLGISFIFFIIFSRKGNPKFAKFGYILGLFSVGMVLISVIINYITYNTRLMNYIPLLIAIATCITELNIGTIIFVKRKDLELYLAEYFKKASQDIKEKLKHLCPYCGFKVEPDHKYCKKCGKLLK